MARENSSWGYDRIVGALTNLGHHVTDQTVANASGGTVLIRHPSEAKTLPGGVHRVPYGGFGRNRFLLRRSADLAWTGDRSCIVLYSPGKSAYQPGGDYRIADEAWMQQMARNATDENWGHIAQRYYALHDRDTKFCASFRTTLAAGGIRPIQLPARSPNLNAFAERRVRSGEAGVFVETDPIGRGIAATCAGRIRRAFSYGAKSPRQRQHPAVSVQRNERRSAPKISIVPRTARWFAQILLSCRMNILAIRGPLFQVAPSRSSFATPAHPNSASLYRSEERGSYRGIGETGREPVPHRQRRGRSSLLLPARDIPCSLRLHRLQQSRLQFDPAVRAEDPLDLARLWTSWSIRIGQGSHEIKLELYEPFGPLTSGTGGWWKNTGKPR